MYSNEELKKSNLFNKLDFFMISNHLLFFACNKYKKDFRENIVPKSYVTYYISEFNKKQNQMHEYLKKFFLCLQNNVVELDTIIDVFTKSKKPNAKIKTLTKKAFFSGLEAGTYIELPSSFLNKMYSYTINSSDLDGAITSAKYINENILKEPSKRFIENYKNFKTTTFTSSASDIEQIFVGSSDGTIISGTSKQRAPIRLPSLKRSVEKLVVPKFTLPSSYPRSTTESRVDSRYFVRKFTNPSTQITIISRYGIKKVFLHNNFLEKRKEIVNHSSAASKKSKFSDFF